MSNEVILLLLRIFSSLLLMSFLLGLMVILWRDYRLTGVESVRQRQSYGRLIVLQLLDGRLLATGESYSLLPMTTLGRAPTNTVILDDPFASTEHARVTLQGEQWWLEDFQSRNGTYLNDIRVNQRTVITNGDVIAIGNLRLKLELESI